MKFRFSLSILLLLTALISCNQKSKKAENEKTVIFFDQPFSSFGQTDSLTINAAFSECGEWGGHKETIVINIDNEKRFYATHKVYPFNCDSLDYYYTNTNIQPSSEQMKFLDDNRKQSITNYMQRLIQSKITERFPGHAGNSFSIIKSDSTFFIRVYDTKEYDVNSFRQLVTEVF